MCHRSEANWFAFILESNLSIESALRDLARFFSGLHALTGCAGSTSMAAVKAGTPKKKKSGASATREYSAPALKKGIEIVELLAGVPGGLTISEITTRLRRSMNEVFRIVVVMESLGWLQKDAETSRYSVTYHLLELALRATPAQSLTAAAAPVMERLSIDTNQSCHLVVRAAGRGLIVERQENASLQGGFALRAGASVDLVRSCSGHVLLAFLAPHVYDVIIRQLPRPAAWPLGRFNRRLAQVRKRGFEIQPSFRTAGVTDIGFPIFAFDGRVVAALTVPYLTLIDDSAPASLEETRELLGAAARRISARLGHSPGNPRSRGGITLAL
jgi:DNA-binding IclR family transcriptional regulator